jgi:hypothetical protein
MVTLQEAQQFKAIYEPIIRRAAWFGFAAGIVAGFALGGAFVLFIHT